VPQAKLSGKHQIPTALEWSHSSIMPMIIHGKRMYVYNAVVEFCGVSAEGITLENYYGRQLSGVRQLLPLLPLSWK